MTVWAGLLFIAGLLIVSLVFSGVLPRFIEARRGAERVEEFAGNYRALVAGDASKRDWLLARRAEMQRDAMSVDLGVSLIAPPPYLGGGQYQQHQMFYDLFGEQSFSETVTVESRLDTLVTAEHELRARRDARKRELLNPGAWIRLAFERIVGFPRYLLTQAGFSSRVTDSTGARVVTVVWGFMVGAATIGSFVLALLSG